MFARAKRDLPGVRVRFGRMSDFADAILREKPDLPVVRGDTPDTWIHGIGSMPIETQLAHATRPRIAALESLDTLLGTWGVPTEPAAPIVRDAYENTLLFGEHTWGPDVARYAGYSYGDEWKKKLAAGRISFPPGGIRPEAGLRAPGRRAGRAGHPASGWPHWPRRSTCRAAGSSSSIRCPGPATARSKCPGPARPPP